MGERIVKGARYLVTGPIDSGQFRGVAVLRDGSKRDVAIMRVLPNPTKNDKFVAMFLGELRSTLLLQHANIVEVLDIAKTPEGAYFVVTEYVEGCSLKALVARDTGLAIQHVLHVVIECCKALAHAHSRGVIHRDVCPRDILLSNEGDVKVTDFGLAKANSQIESSDPGIVKGKFSYLAPEAASGLEVDRRADVFAAGIVLWELLASRRLFLGETDYQTVMLVRDARYVPIEGLAPALDEIVRKALARDVNDRYRSATALADALEQYAASIRIKASPAEMALLVRDVNSAIARAREPMDPEKLARIQADVRRMTSIMDDNGGGTPSGWN